MGEFFDPRFVITDKLDVSNSTQGDSLFQQDGCSCKKDLQEAQMYIRNLEQTIRELRDRLM